MTETETNDQGNEVAVNSRWRVNHERDYTAGDVRDDDLALDIHGEPTRLVQLPTGPVEDRDQGIIPGCSFCNGDQHLSERLGENMKAALDQGELPTDLTREDFIILADYGILGTESNRILAYGCHACVQ